MQTTPDIGPTHSPPAGAVPDAASSRGRRHPARRGYARLLSVLRGDKYMINAYPPAWRSPVAATEVHRPDGTAEGMRSSPGEHPAATTYRSVQ
jgi:hypothetical protein